jgi:arylsulfatase A-like enzyme
MKNDTDTAPKSDQTSSIQRREFVKMIGSASALLAAQGVAGGLPLNAAQSQAIHERRNFIIFLTDQERLTTWFPEGWETANRPTLTALKNTGVTFTNYFSVTSMCTPARNTLFTGLYPAQHRAPAVVQQVNIGTPAANQLDPELPNLATVLRGAGYEVVYKGKWHLTEGTVGPDGVKVYDEPERYGFEGWNGPDIGSDSDPARLYGGGSYNQDGRIVEGYDPTQSDATATYDPSTGYAYTGGINPTYQQQSALAFLQEKVNTWQPGDQPFCLVVSLVNPHDLIGYPTYSGDKASVTMQWGYDRNILKGDVITAPTTQENLLTNFKPTTQASYNQRTDAILGTIPASDASTGQSGDENYINLYANVLREVDNRFGQLLSVLNGSSVRNHSWIIYTSDHGELGLTHGGLKQKGFCAYNESIRVPMVWSNPVDYKTGATCNQLVSSVDFVPTVCSLAGLNPKDYQFSGVDYSRLISNPTGPAIQNSILFSYDDIYAGQSYTQFPAGIVPPPNRVRALITKESKYVYYFDGDGKELPQDEYYDIRTKQNGGTDTDQDMPPDILPVGYVPTGLPVEYRNLSEWADKRRKLENQAPLATPEVVALRTAMKQELMKSINTKLQPFATRPPTPPKDFSVELLNWTNQYGQQQSDLQIRWISRNTTQYQLQMSRDQVTWTSVGTPLEGNNGPMLITEQATDFQVFYRLAWSANTISTILPEPKFASPLGQGTPAAQAAPLPDFSSDAPYLG